MRIFVGGRRKLVAEADKAHRTLTDRVLAVAGHVTGQGRQTFERVVADGAGEGGFLQV